MPLNLEPESPPLRMDDTGTVRVGKTRVILEVVVQAFKEGTSPEQIAADFDSLTLADVYSTIGHYLRHQTEFDAYLANRAREASELRKQVESDQSHLPDLRSRVQSAHTEPVPT